MLRIAVIDDDKVIGDEFEQYIKISCDKLQIKVDIDVYYVGERFCDVLKNIYIKWSTCWKIYT